MPSRGRLATVLANLLILLVAHGTVLAQAAPQLTSAVSRKSHGGTNYDIALPLTGNSGIECRRVTSLGMRLILTFDQPITSMNAPVVAGTGTAAAPTIAGNVVTLNFTGLANSQTMTVTLNNVTAELGGVQPSVAIPLRIQEGDCGSNGTMTGSDVNLTKSRVGKPVTVFTFRSDINCNGSITGSDVNLVKAKVGAVSVGATTTNTPPTIGDLVDETIFSGVASPAVEFAVADNELPAASLGVSATSSNPALIPANGFALGGSGTTRTLSITPNANVTGTAIVTVTVGDGLTSASDTLNVTVLPGPKLFLAHMTPQGNASTSGSGTSTLLMDGDRKAATIRFSYSNLTGPITQHHVHGPAAVGQSGGIIFDFDTATPEADGSFRWVFGDTVYTAEQIAGFIEQGLTYINLHTSVYPNGEIRGQYGLAAGSQTFTKPPPPPALPSGPPTAEDAARFLTQATFGPTIEDIGALQASSFDAWLSTQFASQPPSSPNWYTAYASTTYTPSSVFKSVYDRCTTSTATADALASDRVTESWWKAALRGDDQLRQRVAFAYSQILVVSSVEDTIDVEPAGLASYHDMLADNAFVNFRVLLEDMTLHPIMGQYLNMRGNVKPSSSNNFKAPNENFAREILQLFSIGLNQLQPDGTLKLGPDGLPIPTYSQEVVEGFSHVFTGWREDATAVVIPTLDATGAVVDVSTKYIKPMLVNPANHSTTAKLLLNNATIPSTTSQTVATANAELDAALDNIFNHPNVGPFICRQLIQRLVTSNPSPAYVYRVAHVFDGYRGSDPDGSPSAPRGDMQAVIRAVLLDYEARTVDVINNPGFGHVREPLVRASAVIRAFHPTSVSGHFKIGRTDNEFEQTPYRAITVFNFFEPGYVEPGELAAFGLVAPELQITNETTTMNTLNFLYTGIGAASNPNFKGDVKLDLTTEQNLASSSTALLDRLNLLLMQNRMPAPMYTRIRTFIDGLPSGTDAQRLARAKAAIHLVATSAQFATQK
ncbi:MAG: DUF1800 family protein [Tepidisphaeraceae bacterium]